jgi:hypothetical protein
MFRTGVVSDSTMCGRKSDADVDVDRQDRAGHRAAQPRDAPVSAGGRMPGADTPDHGFPDEEPHSTPDAGAPRHRVTFGIGAVVVGLLVGVVSLALAFALPWGSGAVGVFVVALGYGLGIGLVTGLPLGIVVGLLLRPVRHQWVHVAVFFAAFAVAAFAVAALLSPSTALGDSLPTALVIGGAGALARASVWKLVQVR